MQVSSKNAPLQESIYKELPKIGWYLIPAKEFWGLFSPPPKK